jgi:hypothetical protein
MDSSADHGCWLNLGEARGPDLERGGGFARSTIWPLRRFLTKGEVSSGWTLWPARSTPTLWVCWHCGVEEAADGRYGAAPLDFSRTFVL